MRWAVAVLLCWIASTACRTTDSTKAKLHKNSIRKDTTKIQRPKPITQGEIDRWE